MYHSVDLIFSIITVLLVLEAGRRVIGWGLPVLALLFMLYARVRKELSPGYLCTPRIHLGGHLRLHVYGPGGHLRTAIGVSASYIFLFILFGAILSKSGMGQFFNDLALALAGSSKGGPAKVAVLSSAFLGSINGSAVANVVTTGAFTIPLMKKIGYQRNFAGAVEASASVGGQVLPPVMGAAAFIMAETLESPIPPSPGRPVAGPVVLSERAHPGPSPGRPPGAEGHPPLGNPAGEGCAEERGHLAIPLRSSSTCCSSPTSPSCTPPSGPSW